MSSPDMVALPASLVRLLVAVILLAVVIMLAIFAVEIVILMRFFELLDLIRRIAPPA